MKAKVNGERVRKCKKGLLVYCCFFFIFFVGLFICFYFCGRSCLILMMRSLLGFTLRVIASVNKQMNRRHPLSWTERKLGWNTLNSNKENLHNWDHFLSLSKVVVNKPKTQRSETEMSNGFHIFGQKTRKFSEKECQRLLERRISFSFQWKFPWI